MTTIDSMMAAVEKRAPKVPIVRKGGGPVTSTGEPSGALEASETVRPARAPKAPRRASGQSGILSKRLMRVQLTPEQERWLMDVVGDAYKDGQRVSEAAIVRLAIERLRRLGWADLKSEVR